MGRSETTLDKRFPLTAMWVIRIELREPPAWQQVPFFTEPSCQPHPVFKRQPLSGLKLLEPVSSGDVFLPGHPWDHMYATSLSPPPTPVGSAD